MDEGKRIREVMDEHRIFVTEELVEAGYQRLLDGPDAVVRAATLERRGGACPYCAIQFLRIEVDNKFGKFAYYQPACRCFRVCREVKSEHGRVDGCGRFLITEKFAGIDYCTSCYAQAPGTKTKATRTHKRAYGGKDAAAGEKE